MENKDSEKQQNSAKEREHKVHHGNSKGVIRVKKRDLLVGIVVVIGIILAITFFVKGFKLGGVTGVIDDTGSSTTGEIVTSDVVVDFYVMSQCPFGTQVEDAIKPVLEKLGENIEFNLEYIANDNGDGTFSSLHGQSEVEGDIVQLCAAKYNPDIYMDMIVCQNKNARAIPGNWEQCAKENNLDVENIRACFEGEEGKQLLAKSIKKAIAVRARGSPTIYINDVQYSGRRGTNDFFRAICNEFETKPEPCKEIPKPKQVNVITLNDKRCKECNVDKLIGQLKSIFPGLKVKNLDYNSAEGKKLYKELNLKLLPAILFDESVKEGEGYPNVQRYLVGAGDYYSLNVGARFDPKAEICDNEMDDDGDGKIDCEDDTCKDKTECREELKNNLQVFIMSDCPYGRKAVEALKEVVGNFGDNIDYNIHYIASEQGDGFRSLHGQYEVDEDIIQLCVKEHSPDEWFDYVYCRSTNGVRGKDWKECAKETKVRVNDVQRCFEGEEGKALLKEDIKIANSLGIGASPTWLANNRKTFSGIDAETVKTNFCESNPGLEGCEKTLSAGSGAPSGSCN
jgi:glutaredoxin